MRPLAILITASLILAGRSPAQKPTPPTPEPEAIRQALQALAEGKGDWALLAVTYDDMHPLHGGLTLTLRGTGQVEQNAVRCKAGVTRAVSRSSWADLLALLRELQAWEQRVPERQPVPDESRARLTLRYGDHAVTIWEWYNDLARNNRIQRVRELMKTIAWKPATP